MSSARGGADAHSDESGSENKQLYYECAAAEGIERTASSGYITESLARYRASCRAGTGLSLTAGLIWPDMTCDERRVSKLIPVSYGDVQLHNTRIPWPFYRIITAYKSHEPQMLPRIVGSEIPYIIPGSDLGGLSKAGEQELAIQTVQGLIADKLHVLWP
jgi:hypothetical protein